MYFEIDLAGAIVFGCLFTVLFLVHACLQLKYKAGGTYWTVLIACLVSAAAYWSKMVSYGWKGSAASPMTAYICYVVLAFMAPFFINSYLYTLLRGLYVAFIPIEPVPSNPVAIFWIFQILDGIVWILQIVAVSILWFEQEVATYLLFAAFIGQLLVYVTFLIVLARFHSRASKHRKAGTLASQTESTRGGSPPRSYKATVVTMYIVPFLLGVRAVYYLVNCGTPHYWFSGVVDPYWDHTYYRNTWWLKWWEPGQIGLDATPVFLALLVLAWPTANPGRTLKRKHRGPNLEAWRYGAQGPPAQQRVGGVDNWRYGAQGPAAAPQSYNGVETWRYGAQGPPEMQQRRLGDAELARELEMRNLRAVPREQTVSYHEAAEGAILEKEGGTHVTV